MVLCLLPFFLEQTMQTLKRITEPWLWSLDGLDTHDNAYHLSAAGGVTTSLVLPDSANAFGMCYGQLRDHRVRVNHTGQGDMRSQSRCMLAVSGHCHMVVSEWTPSGHTDPCTTRDDS
ncbi:hypothetical protein EV401DRAFT_1884216 [Pisolithus croceorrhizus]|nr:hypothetical protein EV401DRAFT_1884216 [Pisolithus croceorrhizus]